jgi:DNA-binding CsgD family transcriptional regulator
MDNNFNLLSDREIEVLQLVGQGKSNKDIAGDLNISINTVKVHIGNIFQKISVSSRTEATLFAIEHGIIKSPASPIPEIELETMTTPILEQKPTWSDVFRQNRWIFLVLSVLVLSGLYLLISKPAFLMSQESPVEVPQQKWENLASLNAPRSSMAVAIFEEKIIIIGGHSNTGAISAVEMFDPASNAWSILSEKPTAVYDASAVVIGEKIYVPGGVTQDGTLTKVVEVFNPRKNTWERAADLPVAISAYGLASYEGQIFLFGGSDSKIALDSVWRYDPNTDTWNQGSPMPTARMYPSVLADAGKIYVMGGLDGASKLNANESYSPYTELEKENPWQVEPDLPQKLSGYTAIKLYDKISVIGGKSSVSGAIDQFHYSAIQKEWQIANINTETTSAISEAAYVLLGEYIYAIGGMAGEGFLDNVSRYQAMYTILLPLTIN